MKKISTRLGSVIIISTAVIIFGGVYIYQTSFVKDFPAIEKLIQSDEVSNLAIDNSPKPKIDTVPVSKNASAQKNVANENNFNMVTVPGLNGPERIDSTNIQYKPCILSSARAVQNPQPTDLSSKSGIVVQEDEIFYDVDGTNSLQLLNQIFNCTIPTQDLDKGATAITESIYNYSLEYDNISNQICNIRNVAVGMHLSQLLPKWTRYSEASGELVEMWDAFYIALKKHEDNHADIFKQYADKEYAYINGLSVSGACVPSLDTITAKQDEIVNEANEANAKYDLETNRGVNEGIYDYLMKK